MIFAYEILETFDTSFGLIAMIKFDPPKFPGLDADIYYNQQKYKIAGYTLTYQPVDPEKDKVAEMRQQGIWDCLLKPVLN